MTLPRFSKNPPCLQLTCNSLSRQCQIFTRSSFLKTRTKVKQQLSVKVKVILQQAMVAQGVPGRLRPWIFLMFRHYKGGRSSAVRTGHLYPRRNPWYSFSEAESTPGHSSVRGSHGKNSQ